MSLYETSIPTASLPSNFFTLTIAQLQTKTNITMCMNIPITNTRELPSTFHMLKKHLPTILMAQCFNSEELPFAKEVKQTEVGHLFEHMILEYLCILHLDKGYEQACFEGFTNWNWVKHPRGTFHITINAGENDQDIFEQALNHSIVLVSKIFERDKLLPLSYQSPAIYRQISL